MDGWMDGCEERGHKIEPPSLVLLNSPKIGIHARCSPQSRYSASNRPCNSHSSYASSFSPVTRCSCGAAEAELDTRRRDQHSAARNVNGLPVGGRRLAADELTPMHKHAGLCRLICRLAGRRTCAEEDGETKWTGRPRKGDGGEGGTGGGRRHQELAGELIKWVQ